MHGSLHLILANESARARNEEAREARRAGSVRRPLAALASRIAAAHGIPPRVAPGQSAASLRGR
jgi:hypothetical protein